MAQVVLDQPQAVQLGPLNFELPAGFTPARQREGWGPFTSTWERSVDGAVVEQVLAGELGTVESADSVRVIVHSALAMLFEGYQPGQPAQRELGEHATVEEMQFHFGEDGQDSGLLWLIADDQARVGVVVDARAAGQPLQAQPTIAASLLLH
ncbi:hypothetical protein [Corynebacterium aquilae]|uniref:hypothetical protein n=1 Tax=Corynebacterium aquilae TaxID=203263 RepID=UPI0012ECE323|nr:hypothetical protein [Corynebacterium aquilae]